MTITLYLTPVSRIKFLLCKISFYFILINTCTTIVIIVTIIFSFFLKSKNLFEKYNTSLYVFFLINTLKVGDHEFWFSYFCVLWKQKSTMTLLYFDYVRLNFVIWHFIQWYNSKPNFQTRRCETIHIPLHIFVQKLKVARLSKIIIIWICCCFFYLFKIIMIKILVIES